MNDTSLEEIFSNYNSKLTDDTKFMSSLERKLEAVQYIHQYQEAQQRQNKTAMLIVFAVGLCLGAGAIAFILSLPADFTLYTFGFKSAIFVWMGHNFRLISILPLSILICYISVSIMNLWQELRVNHLSWT